MSHIETVADRVPLDLSHHCFLAGQIGRRVSFSFFHDTASPDIYTLSLHDALPILAIPRAALHPGRGDPGVDLRSHSARDRKSTRLNSSHEWISYAVFCLKKKNTA